MGGRNSCYRSADILVRLGLANAAEADKNVRAPFAFLHVLGDCELRPLTGFVHTFPSGAADYYQSVPAHVTLPSGKMPQVCAPRWRLTWKTGSPTGGTLTG